MKFIYLVQSQVHLVKKLFHLQVSTNENAFFLTSDEEIVGAIFFQKSTLAVGRNKLLTKAISACSDYDYLVFVDDDTDFYLGSGQQFEHVSQTFRLAIGVPVFDRIIGKTLRYPLFSAQRLTFHDEQLMALSKQVVNDKILLPYQTQFDESHWLATCRVQQILIHNVYTKDVLQLNSFRVSNLEHDLYDAKANNDESYKYILLAWVRSHYSDSFTDINRSPIKIYLFFKTLFSWLIHRHYRSLLTLAGVKGLLQILETKKNLGVSLSQVPGLIEANDCLVLYGYGEVGKPIYYYVGSYFSALFTSVADKAVTNKDFQSGGLLVQSSESLLNKKEIKVLVASFSFKSENKVYLQYKIGLKNAQIYYVKPLQIESCKQ